MTIHHAPGPAIAAIADPHLLFSRERLEPRSAMVEASWGRLFEAQPDADVQEALDAARWVLADVAANPAMWPPATRDVYAEVAQEASHTLAARRAAPRPIRLPADLDEIKRRLPVDGYVARCAPAVAYDDRRGGTRWTRCPFPDHPERTPSFKVEPATGLWFCFGCRRGGSVVDFHMRWHGVSLRDAIAELSWEAGITPPRPGAVRGVIRGA